MLAKVIVLACLIWKQLWSPNLCSNPLYYYFSYFCILGDGKTNIACECEVLQIKSLVHLCILVSSRVWSDAIANNKVTYWEWIVHIGFKSGGFEIAHFHGQGSNRCSVLQWCLKIIIITIHGLNWAIIQLEMPRIVSSLWSALESYMFAWRIEHIFDFWYCVNIPRETETNQNICC